MAIAAADVESLALSVKHAVGSPSKCTTSVLKSLEVLLADSKEEGRVNAKLKTKSADRKNRNISQEKPVNPPKSQSRAATKVTTLHINETRDQQLSRTAKVVFATDVFNAALKVLNNACKDLPPAQPFAKPRNPPFQERAPLQSISPNAKLRSPDKQKNQSHNAKTHLTTNIELTATCAQRALCALRTLQKEEAKKDASRKLSLIQATSILLSKLIILKLVDLVWIELQAFRSLLRTKDDLQQPPEITKPEFQRLAELLQFECLPKNDAILKLFFTFQIQSLKYFASRASKCISEDIVNTLEAQENGPVANVLKALETDRINSDFASQQLVNLSQCISNLARAAIASVSQYSPTFARQILTLQCMSLEIRCRWWQTADHRPDVFEEIWKPLSKYLSAFHKRRETLEKNDFYHCSRHFEKLQARVSTHGFMLESPKHLPLQLPVADTLAQIAEESGCWKEALTLYQTITCDMEKGANIDNSMRLCKIACVHLRILSDSTFNIATEALAQARSTLSAPMKGTADAIDDLSTCAFRLQRTAMKTLIGLSFSEGNDNVEPDAQSCLRTFCVRAINDVILFTNRYVGEASTGCNKEAELHRYHARVEKVNKHQVMVAEAFFLASRRSIESNEPPWEETETILSHFATLIEKLGKGRSNKEFEMSMDSRQPLHVRLSNLYWARYLKMKASQESVVLLATCLHKATQCLRDRSPAEQQAGNLTEKLMKLGHTWAEVDEFDKASKSYKECLATLSELNVIAELAADAAHKSFEDVWSSRQASKVDRVLQAFVRIAKKNSSPLKVFDVVIKSRAFSVPELCLLVERQIHVVSNTGSSGFTKRALLSLYGEALKLLDPSNYPIRRLRILRYILQLDSEDFVILPEDLRMEACSEVSRLEHTQKDLGADEQLARFRPVHLSSAQLLAAFQSGRPSFDHCQHAIASWKISLQLCNTWEAVENRIENPKAFIHQLDTLAEYMDMQNQLQQCVELYETSYHLLELQPNRELSALVRYDSLMGSCLTRQGYSNRAGYSLARAKPLLDKAPSAIYESLQWRLSNAEYLLSIGNLDETFEALKTARGIYQRLHELDVDARLSLNERIRQDVTLAHACFLYAKLFWAKQDIRGSFASARQCVRLTSRSWATLEKANECKTSSDSISESQLDVCGSELGRLEQGMRKLEEIRSAKSTLSGEYLGSKFWSHTSLHCRGLMQLAMLSAKSGLFQDTIYYGEQARKVAISVGAESWLATIEARSTSHLILAGLSPERLDSSPKPPERPRYSGDEMEVLENMIDIAKSKLYSQHKDQRGDAVKIIAEAECELRTLQSTAGNASLDVQDVIQEMAQLQIEPTSYNPQRRVSASRGKKTKPKKNCGVSNPRISKTQSPLVKSSLEPFSLTRVALDLKCIKARILVENGEFDEAINLLKKCNSAPSHMENKIPYSVLLADALLGKVMDSLSGDAVYYVLAESCISYPSISGNLREIPNVFTAAQKDTMKGKATNRKKVKEDVQIPQCFLQQAQDQLLAAFQGLAYAVDVHLIRQFCSTWNRLAFLASAFRCDLKGGPTAMQAVSCLDRVCPIRREQMTIDIDKCFSGYEQSLLWPEPCPTEASKTDLSDELSTVSFLTKNLPKNWSAISLRLADDSQEIVISKLSRDSTPFHLRLPLCRSSAEDSVNADETLDFCRCKDELKSIIASANKTSHDGRACRDKQSKKEWWAERNLLDQRLKNLLDNVEMLWFGGFKGVLLPHSTQLEPLSKFSQSFTQILNNNLPSRRKGKRVGPALHPHVLNLFVALGNPCEADPEDAITELLYFVVDILQFQGEQNAYDEIDFDVMLLQTLDAIRGYHDICSSKLEEICHHTILVLDKNLHAFPWESLPCLQKQSVSRLPSFDCLRQRILQIGSIDCASLGIKISRSAGSYILNPSSDLEATEDAFAERFSRSLPSFSSIVHRAPSEEEFKSCLENSAVCLYFGHGSGSQYIRGRTVRRLKKCAVTFLMGCSSSTLVECGMFEPYGVPWNYMHAGSPAVVGTLWDVTDKDIDRFAMQTLEEWGLLETNVDGSHSKVTDTNGTRKGRPPRATRKAEPAAMKATTTLVDAVKKARNACNLRYLNGAAPVIYGIPVHLDLP
ncbi:MAG: hypothetical protein Q9227_007527 [Pyrenula ochraceoflavens]